MQALIGAPYPPHFNAAPKDAAAWKELIGQRTAPVIAMIPALKEKLGVDVEATKIAGVNVFIVTPKNPAAMDDAMAVRKELVKTNKPANMAVFGTSTRGAMTLALVLRARAEKVPLPAAIAPGTPWSDNVLVTWDGWLGRAALLYADARDLKDPQLSPIYGDFSGFPPAILTTGTRDLFLSNTVRTHRKLRRAGVVADLNVYEGQSHAQYSFIPDAPETREAFTNIAKFFDKYLGR